MDNCTKCKKQKIPADERCDCRLSWQIEKATSIIENLLAELYFFLGEKDDPKSSFNGNIAEAERFIEGTK